MVTSSLINIEVAYAKPEEQVILALQLEPGCTIEEAIKRSGLLQRFPEIDLKQLSVGVFSQPKALSDPVEEGDRVEIYRPLLIDPKEARRVKARLAARRRF